MHIYYQLAHTGSTVLFCQQAGFICVGQNLFVLLIIDNFGTRGDHGISHFQYLIG